MKVFMGIGGEKGANGMYQSIFAESVDIENPNPWGNPKVIGKLPNGQRVAWYVTNGLTVVSYAVYDAAAAKFKEDQAKRDVLLGQYNEVGFNAAVGVGSAGKFNDFIGCCLTNWDFNKPVSECLTWWMENWRTI